MVALDLAMRRLFLRGFFQRSHLVFGEQDAFLGRAGFQNFETRLYDFQIQIARTPEDATMTPVFCSSQLARF